MPKDDRLPPQDQADNRQGRACTEGVWMNHRRVSVRVYAYFVACIAGLAIFALTLPSLLFLFRSFFLNILFMICLRGGGGGFLILGSKIDRGWGKKTATTIFITHLILYYRYRLLWECAQQPQWGRYAYLSGNAWLIRSRLVGYFIHIYADAIHPVYKKDNKGVLRLAVTKQHYRSKKYSCSGILVGRCRLE